MRELLSLALIAASWACEPANAEWGSEAQPQETAGACAELGNRNEGAGTCAALRPQLPDAPQPADSFAGTFSSSSDIAPGLFVTQRRSSEELPLNQCPDDTTHARECRVHWRQLLISSAVFNAFKNAGNLYSGYWYRYETTHGKWLDRYFDSVLGWRWDHWSDDNPFLDDYIGHPMMGSITNYLWIQNDPRSMTVEFDNSRAYWRSRMRALAFSAAYSFEWKLGPFGEAAIGHNGDHYFYDKDVNTNETGWVELVTTPVGGLLWTMGEDSIDKHLVRRLDQHPHRPLTLLAISFLTPSRATANILRFRPPWYRDGRVVKASSFWSDPPGPEDYVPPEDNAGDDSSAEVFRVQPATRALREWPLPGGKHEFGAWWGLSLMSGHIWGYAKDVKYMPIDVNYSYLLHKGDRWMFRYAPEVTALAMLDEPVPGQTDPQLLRRRSYGSGVSPVGWRAQFFPQNRIQPYLSGVGGFLYFNQRVLSPEGSQFMYTIDYGAGIMIFRKQRQSVSIGYRYQHLSNANISHHNPGTDANTFYVAVSRFRSKGYR